MTDIAIISSGVNTPLPVGPAGPGNTLAIGAVSNGAVATASITGVSPAQILNLTLPNGPANSLAIGTVASGIAAATITGAAPAQTLNLVLPPGPPNSLNIGSVGAGVAAATITGAAPSQTLNLVLPPGPATPSLLTFRNKLHNALFAINQRRVAGTVTLAAGAYGHDRWKAGAAGCTYTFAASGNGTVITISAGSLEQVIEGVNVEGGAYYASWVGTAQARVNGGAYAATGFLTTGLAANTNTTIEFGIGTVSLPQFEPQQSGQTGPTTFEQRFTGSELALCQRFYYRRWNTWAYYGVVAVLAECDYSLCGLLFRFPVTMRASPTSKISALSDFGINVYNTNTLTPITTWYGSGSPNCTVDYAFIAASDLIDPNTSNPQGAAVTLREVTATGWMEFSADL